VRRTLRPILAIVSRDDDRRAPRNATRDPPGERTTSANVEAGERLIEQQQLRLVPQRVREQAPAHLAVRARRYDQRIRRVQRSLRVQVRRHESDSFLETIQGHAAHDPAPGDTTSRRDAVIAEELA
jgi:hypothetical protein